MNSVDYQQAIGLLNSGSVGVLPTDTLYGLVARADDKFAVERLYSLKSRERKPGTVIAADTTAIAILGIEPEDIEQARQYWPAPISVVLPCTLDYLHQGVGSVAVRIPVDEKLRAFLVQTGPLLTSSANAPGKPPATNVVEAQVYFGELVDFYVDGGTLGNELASTVIKIEEGQPIIHRQGAGKIFSDGKT